MRNWRTRPVLTPPQQFQFLRRNPICAGLGSIGPTGLVWNYRTRPTPLSREYAVQIKFRRDDVPHVTVGEPDLESLAGGRDLPHVYHDPTRLCLYLPGSDEWVGSMRIDQTFVPWTATWLYYFEEWLGSDDWKGGGEHPNQNDAETHSRRVRRSVR
jgi:hypothetical protein